MIDRRTNLGKALARWRADLIRDLGGPAAVSTQQECLLDLAVKSKLILDSIDAWVLMQPSLINARHRALLPVVRERTQLADALARYLIALGLEKRMKRVPSLTAYLQTREKCTGEAGASPPPTEARQSDASAPEKAADGGTL